MIATAKVAADPVAPLADHAGAELVQDLVGRFVPAKAKLALELDGGKAIREAVDMSRPPKTTLSAACPFHNRVGGQGCILAALPAAKYAGPGFKAERLCLFAMRAFKALGPACAFKTGARLVCGEKFLELQQGLGEGSRFSHL